MTDLAEMLRLARTKARQADLPWGLMLLEPDLKQAFTVAREVQRLDGGSLVSIGYEVVDALYGKEWSVLVLVRPGRRPS